MIVDSIEMENFKSYGNKQLIKVNQGFTVIIGPNGSGKSNIGDSMLFVLGIRSNKTVRVDKLEDFIHKTDPPRKHCYVTLNVIADEGTRYAIKREISYSGGDYKSNYYINDKRSTRTDVLKLIDSFHIYLDAYSFVLQGDINNLVKMTGTERRKLFESIAGIESYKERIESAQQDIDGLNENLNSMDAVLGEIKNVLEILGADRENAIKYNTINKELEELKLYLKVKDRERLNQELSMYNSNISQNKSDISNLELENKELLEKKDKIAQRIQEIQDQLDAIGGKEILQIRQSIENLNIKIAETNTKMVTLKENVTNSESRIRTSRDAYNFNQEQLEKKNREKKNYESYLRSAENTIKKINGELAKFRQENYENSKMAKELNDKIGDIDAQIQVNNNLLINDNDVNTMEKEISSLSRELTLHEEKIKVDSGKIKDFKWKIENLKANIDDYNREINKVNTEFVAIRNKLNDLVNAKNNNDIEIRNKEKELRGLNYRGGMSPAMKEINTMMQIDKRIYGSISKLIEYNEKYTNAISVAGGGRLNSIVVDDDGVAQECIENLKVKRLGRLTFIPLNKISAGTDRQRAVELVNSGEAIDFVRNLVSYDSKFEKAMKYAFGDTVLMDSMEHARKHMTGVRIVTLEGDVFDPSGAMTGGSIKNDELLANRILKTISELEDSSEMLKSEISIMDKKNSDISTRLADLTRKKDISNSNITSYQTQMQDAEVSLKSSEARIKEINIKIADSEERKKNFEFRKNEIKLTIFKLEKEKEAIFKKLKELSPENVEIEKQMEGKLDEAQKSRENYSNNLVQIETEIGHSEEKSKELQEKIQGLEKEISDNKKLIEKYNADLDSMRSELTEDKQRENEIESRSGDLYMEKSKISREQEDIFNSMRKNDDLISNKKTIIASLNAKIENMSFQLETITYEIENSSVQFTDFKLSINEVNAKIAGDSRKIAELGAVNMKAIEQYDREMQRYDNTESKYKTLMNEKNDLIELQNQIIEDEKKKFLELLDTINEQFKKIYARLSEGGEANLEITSRDDPLNAEVYIKVKPMGKQMIKIDALSGGEKSVAVLALILSFQIKNPSPIYYLDEVDMFLDGHNAEHVGELFKENSRTSQVVMVSLKGAVSKFADNLIGVTTDHRGNTKIVQKKVGDNIGERRDT